MRQSLPLGIIERIIDYFDHPSTYLFRHYSESHQPLRSLCLVSRGCFGLGWSTYTRVIQLRSFEQLIPLCTLKDERPWSDDVETLIIRNRINWPPLEEEMIRNLTITCPNIVKLTIQDVGSVDLSVFALFPSLTTLQVSSVHYNETVVTFPRLVSLTLASCSSLNTENFLSPAVLPSLRSLALRGHFNFESKSNTKWSTIRTFLSQLDYLHLEIEDFTRIPFRELPLLHAHKILVDCLPSQHRIYERCDSFITHLRLLTSTYPHFYEQEIQRQVKELTHFVDVFSRTSSRNSPHPKRSIYLNNHSPQHTRVNQVFVQLAKICWDRNIRVIWEEQPDENEEGVDVLVSPEFGRRAERRAEKTWEGI